MRCDYKLKETINVLKDPLAAFQNPLTSRIGSIQQAGFSAKSQLAAELAATPGNRPPGLTDQEWDARVASAEGLETLFDDLIGSGVDATLESKIGQLKSYTDWQSGLNGPGGIFPGNVLGGIGTQVNNAAGLALLGTATFTTLMGVAGASKVTAFQRDCEQGQIFDLPNIPLPIACEGTNNIFAMLLGAYNTALDAMNSTFAGLTNFLTRTAEELRSITSSINKMIDSVVTSMLQELNALAKKLADAATAGLAKLLKGLALDPCTAAILGTIGKPALRSALNLVDTGTLVGSLNIPDYA